jgi:hypothetical protein
VTCREFDLLLDRGDALELSPEARRHAADCPRCRALAEALSGAAAPLPGDLLEKAQRAATRNLRPVRTLSAPWRAALGAAALLALVAVAAIEWKGVRGWEARLGWQRAASYGCAIGVLAFTLATAMRERVPGLSLAGPWRRLGAALATLLWLGPFALYLFHPEATFWRHGLRCYSVGLMVGVAASIALWLVLRRGYITSPARAGWFAGLAAGSVAFLVQETYCPVVESAHSALWHGGVPATLCVWGWLAGRWIFGRGAPRP